MSYHLTFIGILGWASTAPLLKAAQGLHMSKSGPDNVSPRQSAAPYVPGLCGLIHLCSTPRGKHCTADGKYNRMHY